jgi:membrane fusion protein (multidrug efflux system)
VTNPKIPSMRSATAVLAALFVFACGGNEQAGAPQGPPPPEVSVMVVQPQAITNVVEVPGRVQAVRTSEVRARVDGIVERRVYTEGTDVQAGQLLFLIDSLPLQARLNAAEAALAAAEAVAANAAQDVARYKGLVEKKAISQQEFDATIARARSADANVEAARAQVEAARLNLSYARVTAPISGRASRAEVTEGALVSAAAATLLTTIEQFDPIYVNFSQSSSEMLALRRAVASGNLEMPEGERITARLVLEDGTEYEQEGLLNFRDLSIDRVTGTTAMRAEFRNPNRTLLPGQFVRVRLAAGTLSNGITVPQRAVNIGANSTTVFVVGEGDTLAVRPVRLGPMQGDQWVILEGLSAGDRVVLDGQQKIQPGIVVRVAQ